MTRQQQRLARYIKSRINKFNLTQADVARCTGVTPSYISKLINGKWYTAPSHDFARNLATCFGDFPSDVFDAAGMYDRDKLDNAIAQNPDIARQVRMLYEKAS